MSVASLVIGLVVLEVEPDLAGLDIDCVVVEDMTARKAVHIVLAVEQNEVVIATAILGSRCSPSTRPC